MRKRVLILAMLALIPTMVLAATDGGTTTLNVPAGKSTSTFYFKSKNHVLRVAINQLKKPANPQKAVTAGFQHVWYATSPKQRETKQFNTELNTYAVIAMSEQSKGDYHYEFAAFSNAFGRSATYQEYSGFVSDYVLLDSHD